MFKSKSRKGSPGKSFYRTSVYGGSFVESFIAGGKNRDGKRVVESASDRSGV